MMNSNATVAPLSDDTAIWRYMDLPRFISMLATKTLWFSKAAHFNDDPYEGYCRVTPIPFPSDEYGPGPLTLENTGGKPVPISSERFAAHLSHFSADYFEKARDHLYVNSWCLAEESMAMWEIYGSTGSGIAVKSSIGQYRKAAKFPVESEQFAFDKVHYHSDITAVPDLQLDFRDGSIPMAGRAVWEKLLKLAFHKRICFDFEREWRGALYQDERPGCPGCNIDFDMSELIKAVYIGPRAVPFLFDVVSSVLQKFDLKKPLEKSALLLGPKRKAAAAR